MSIIGTEGENSTPPVKVEESLIKLQVVSDTNSVQTMQLKRVFNKRVVLIDSGATHNFIHPTLLKRLKAPVTNLLPLNVMLASGVM